MRHTPCGYCPPALAAAKAPLFVEGGKIADDDQGGEENAPSHLRRQPPLHRGGHSRIFTNTLASKCRGRPQWRGADT